MNKLRQLLLRASSVILRPVGSEAVFFTLTVLLGCSAPLSMMLIARQPAAHYLIYTFCVCAVETYLLCLLLRLLPWSLPRMVLKTAVYTFFGFFALLESGCYCLLGSAFNSSMLDLVLETSPGEAGDCFNTFFKAKVLPVWLIGAAAVYCAVVLVRRLRRLGRHEALRIYLAVQLPVILVYGIVQIIFLAPVFTTSDSEQYQLLGTACHKGRPDLTRAIQLNLSDPILKTYDIAKEYRLTSADIDRWERLQEQVLTIPCTPAEGRDFNIVVVIGESFIRSHSSLYGYGLPTNPLLGKELRAGRLVLYTDMATPANLTTEVMRQLLNLNDVAAGEKWYDSLYFPGMMKRAGWRVCHYDNQTVGIGRDNGISRLFYSDFNMRHTLDGISDSLFSYDLPFVQHVADSLLERDTAGAKALVIYHLMGQHFDAKARFDTDPVFTVADIRAPSLSEHERQLVADYDNATLYNDMVVARIIDAWRSKPTVLFYFSDHGENLPDLGPMGARVSDNTGDPAWLERQFHIPFMVWMSDSFATDYPQLADKMRQAAGKPGSLDKFGYMILGLSGADTPAYRSDRDMLDSLYAPLPRVSTAGVPYSLNSGVDR